jgi:uncharacterized protein YbaP (TraB family)
MRFLAFLMLFFATLIFPALASERLSHPLLFKVTPAGQAAPVSYVFGSQHYAFGVDDLPPTFLSRFDSAQLYLFEIRYADQFVAIKKYLAHPDNESFLFKIDPKFQSLPKNTLSETGLLTLETFGIHRALGERLPPHNCELLEQFVYFASTPDLRSLDGELELRARSQKKRIEPLETEEVRKAAEQYARERGEADPDENCVISDFLNNPNALKQKAEKIKLMMERYSFFSPKDVLSSSADPSPETQYRNRYWLRELQQILRMTPTFVTVGLYHLPGDAGILQLLKDSGFDVTPVD